MGDLVPAGTARPILPPHVHEFLDKLPSWGLDPIGYHVVNILLHALNGFLAWRILERLKVPGAWFASLLFLLHPIQVESVAWITERKNVLSGFFYLSVLLSYLRFKEEKAGLWPWYFFPYFFFLAALLSKTVTATLPAALLLILWWKEGQFSWRDFFRLIPFFVASIALGSVTVAFETGHIISIGMDEWTFSHADRFLIAGQALWFYLGKLIWPHPLIFIYPRWEIDPSALWQWFFPLSFILLLAVLWVFRSRWGRGPFTAMAFFSMTLLPALGFRNFFPMRFSFVADHFQYLATIGPIGCVVAVAQTALEKHSRIRTVLGVALLLVCSILSWRQSMIYESLEISWRDTLSKNPRAWMAHNNLGTVLMQSGQNDEAELHFKEAIRLKPDNAEAYNNLGGLMATKGKLRKAIAYYQRAIRFQPNSGQFRGNLGTTLLELGKIDKAMFHYLKAIELDPKLADNYYAMGNAFLKKGELKNAALQYREAVRLEPNSAQLHDNFAAFLAKQGKKNEAIEQYNEALRLEPKNPDAQRNLRRLAFGDMFQRSAVNK